MNIAKDVHGKSQFQRGWTKFEANEEGFPHGLKHTITNIRDQHPDIQHIAVWHAIVRAQVQKGVSQSLTCITGRVLGRCLPPR